MKLTITSRFPSSTDGPVVNNPLHLAAKVVQDINEIDRTANVDVDIEVDNTGMVFRYTAELDFCSLLNFKSTQPMFS